MRPLSGGLPQPKGDFAVSGHLFDERGRWLRIALALTAAAVAAALWLAPAAQSNFTTAKCNGTDITGRGASFANAAHQGWITYFTNTYCPGGPNVTYDPAGSGAGRRVVGERTSTNSDGSQSRNQVPRFGMTDEPPTPTGQSQMNQGTDSSGDEGTINVVPAAAGAVVLAVNFPNDCDRSLLPDSAETNPASANASPFVDRVRFTRSQFEEVWNGDSAHDNWTEIFPTLAPDAQCNVPITRVVRFDDSGTSFAFKDYLHHLNGARGWLTTFTTPDTRTWPNATVASRPDCGGAQGPTGTNLTSGCANGNGSLVQKLLTVDGGIGYSDIATARTNGYAITPAAAAIDRDDDIFWTQAPNPSNAFREPTDDANGFRTDGTKGADCENTNFSNVPSATDDDWSQVSGVDSTTGYVICTLTYGLVFTDYEPPYSLQGCGTACEEQKARTVRDYWFAVLSDGGQATLPGNDYDKLPIGLLERARTGINNSCWDIPGGTGTCPKATNYPLPTSAGTVKVSLVPQYEQCTSPNSTHADAPAVPSCLSPTLVSGQLKMSQNPARGQASAKYTKVAGNTATVPDTADLLIESDMTDVLTTAGADYTGSVILTSTMRITDRRNGDIGQLSGTAQDINFGVAVPCVATPASAAGSTCTVDTSADALLPNTFQEGKKAIVSMGGVQVKDAGPNGTIGSSCPLSCGNGDEEVFLGQGVFVP
jgi:ABC-type phosphate transport system substrate-binding protein